MLRRQFLFGAMAPLLLADARQDIFDLFASMASGLSQSNSGQFLRAFDPKMQGFDDFSRKIRALVEQWDVLSAVDVISEAGDEHSREVTLDWMLQISNKLDTLRIERRQQAVKCRLEKQKNWRIVMLDPPAFFAAPEVR